MSDSHPGDESGEGRAIELSVEVHGTPEEVWAAIATGPGITSWYVPTTVEEEPGGHTRSRFGDGPELLIAGRVTAWEPPNRVLFTGPESEGGMAFEWLVQARGDGTCVVRLVNTGFGSGAEWDDQYDAMRDGWRLFLHNLQLHLEHFAGQHGEPMLPMALWAGPREAAWAAVMSGLGLPAAPRSGEYVRADAPDAPSFGGIVVQAEPWRLSVLLDEPAPGTAFIAAEGSGDRVGVSIWMYLYGPDARATIDRDAPLWNQWLGDRVADGTGRDAL